MKIDFHLHTDASFDCKSDPETLVQWAKRKNLDCIAVTDHDTMASYPELCSLGRKYDIQIIPAVEITVSRGTHYLVYFTNSMPEATDDIELIENVHRKGGVVALPHPFRSDTGLMYNLAAKKLYTNQEVEQILAQVDLIEICNAKSPADQNRNAVVLAGANPKLGRIGGSDSHHAATAGAVHTDIPDVEILTPDSLMKHINAKASAIIRLPELDVNNVEQAMQRSVEGVRKLMIKIKPHVPEKIWDTGKNIYSSVNDRLTQKKALRSIDK